MTWSEFVQRLRTAGLLDAQAPDPVRGDASMPWHIRIASGIGAWFAAAFVLGSLGGLLSPLLREAAGRALLGIAACALAAWVMRRPGREGRPAPRDGAFASQVALAVSISGAVLLVSAILDGTRDVTLQGLVIAAIAGVLWWVNPEPLHRGLSAASMVGALVMVLLYQRIEPVTTLLVAVASVVLWLSQPRWVASGHAAMAVPAGLALVASLLLLQLPDAMLLVRGGGGGELDWLVGGQAVLRAAGLAIVLAATGIVIARRVTGVPAAAAASARAGVPVAIVAACLLLAAAAWRTPGVLASLLAWTLGMATGRAQLVTMAWAGLAGYLWLQYWSMQVDLMTKGLVLVGTAAALLVIRLGLGWLLGRTAR